MRTISRALPQRRGRKRYGASNIASADDAELHCISPMLLLRMSP
jgi:hypothetical protein